MNYTVNIIDTENNELVTKVEKAVRSGVVLDWKGGDRKDELNLIGISMNLSVIAEKYVDGYLYHLFTGNETRYKVELVDDNSNILWQGYILPDEYSEPFTNTPVIDITATDGIGRLKGKYLPDEYYAQEKSIIDIISACLIETGLELPIIYAPAIENSKEKDFTKQYINTGSFIENDKRKDVYTILEEMTVLNVVHQWWGYWHIEGVNIREQRVYDAKVYQFDGVFVEEVEITRNYKQINGIATPLITMQPPIGILEVVHENPILEVETDEVTEVENTGWSYITEGKYTGTSSETKQSESLVYATGWASYNGFAAYSGKDNNVFFAQRSAAGDPEQEINLKQNIYVEQGKKYRLKVAVSIDPLSDDDDINQGYVNDGLWENPFLYSINYKYGEGNSKLIASNIGSDDYPEYTPVNFGVQNLENEFELYFIPIQSGEIYITFYPLEDNYGISYVNIDELELELSGQEEEVIISGQVTPDWTTTQDLELPYYDNVNLYPNAFRFEKLYTEENEQLNSYIDIPVRREFEFQGKYYASLPLWGAKLVAENIGEIVRPASIGPDIWIDVNVLDVIYNYNNSDEHIIITEEQIFTGSLRVNDEFYRIGKDRDYWDEWTDTVYRVERTRYGQTAWNVLSRLLDTEIPTIKDFQIKTNIKFNDFIGFDWNDSKDWMLTNCRWDIDGGFTNVSIAERYYISKGNYAPIVEAGDTVYTMQNIAQLTSMAFDPDGFIANYLWEEVTNTGATIDAPNSQDTNIQLAAGVYYARFRITVTDNDGNTAFDEVDVYRRNDIGITWEKYDESPGREFYRLVVTPDIPENTALNIRGRIIGNMAWNTISDSGDIYTAVYLRQNGLIQSQVYNSKYVDVGSGYQIAYKDYSINYMRGDNIEVELASPSLLQNSTYITTVYINVADYMNGFGGIDVIDEKIQYTRIDT